MIAYNFHLNDRELFFAGADWLLRAVEQKDPKCCLPLAYSARYRLDYANRYALCGEALVSLTEIGVYLN